MKIIQIVKIAKMILKLLPGKIYHKNYKNSRKESLQNFTI